MFEVIGKRAFRPRNPGHKCFYSEFCCQARMAHELIGGYPAADRREQIGRFLRHVFPLALESFAAEAFADTLNRVEASERVKSQSRH